MDKTDKTLKSIKENMRARSEKILSNKKYTSGDEREKLLPEETQQMIHELRVYQIELELQNEELVRFQTELNIIKKRYSDLYDLAPIGYCTLSRQGDIQQANMTAGTLLGRERESLIKEPISRYILRDDQDIFYLFNKRLFATEELQSCELRMLKDDGNEFWVKMQATVLYEDDLSPVMHVMLSDISEQKIAEEELRIAAVAFESQNRMVITDSEGIIVRVNPAFSKTTGYSSEEAVGQTIELLSSERHGPLFYQEMWDSVRTEGYWQGEIWNKSKDGEIYAEMLNITGVITQEKGLSHCIISFSDISENKEAEAEIYRLAYYDALTELPNRRLLQDRLHQAVAATARSDQYGAIFFIDLDHFKELNDTRGHDAGDTLLIEVAHRLRNVMREGDTVARQGGDEFVILLENLSSDVNEAAALAKHLGDKLLNAMGKPVMLDDVAYHCKLSIGIRLFCKNDTVEDLFKHADLALYQAKNLGRNMLCFFDPAMQAGLDMRMKLEEELRQAIKEGELELHYQPQTDATGKIVGVEALIRWAHPQRGLIMPNDFIPLAEETGLIVPIGLWVLETACLQLKSWKDDPVKSDLHISVNISARQFFQPDLVSRIERLVSLSGIDPTRLKLELTESLILENVKESVEKMLALKKMGIHFSMDDFGTGYSSLSYLAQLPLDQIKIDQSFVHNLPGSKNDETIIQTIISMGAGLDMNVIAEGVETDMQHVFLEINGCYSYQGYLICKPLPIEELELFFQENSKADKKTDE